MTMQPEMPRQSLAEQPWFIEFLASKGFAKSSPTTFIRGAASLSVDGTALFADPGNGERGWSTDLGGADRATVQAMLEQILKMRPFLTEADHAQEQAARQNLERALTGIANTIRDGPDTGGGVQLRRFLWSLYNQHHLVNLWRMVSVLDSTRSAWVAEVCAGALVGALKEDDIKRALLVAGEIQRWDALRPSGEQAAQIDAAVGKIDELLKAMPPSDSHAQLKRAREALWEAQEALRRAKEPDQP
jgi:hypothetical protein